MRNAPILMMIAVIGMLLMAGCAELEGTGASGSGDYAVRNYKDAVPQAAFAGMDSAAPSQELAQSRQLIKTANAQVQVPAGALDERFAKFKDGVAAMGGQIFSADYSESDTSKEYNINVRIPPQRFDGMASFLKGIGEVKQMSSNVDDVSEQYVDIETRIKNLQIQRDDLRKLYDREGSLQDVLAVENELNRVQTDIEIYQNQKLNIDRQVAMSAVRVRIYEEAPVVDRTVFDPLSQVANVFLGAVGVAIIAISALLGFGIPMAIVGVVLYAVYRRLRPKKSAGEANAGKGRK